MRAEAQPFPGFDDGIRKHFVEVAQTMDRVILDLDHILRRMRSEPLSSELMRPLLKESEILFRGSAPEAPAAPKVGEKPEAAAASKASSAPAAALRPDRAAEGLRKQSRAAAPVPSIPQKVKAPAAPKVREEPKAPAAPKASKPPAAVTARSRLQEPAVEPSGGAEAAVPAVPDVPAPPPRLEVEPLLPPPEASSSDSGPAPAVPATPGTPTDGVLSIVFMAPVGRQDLLDDFKVRFDEYVSSKKAARLTVCCEVQAFATLKGLTPPTGTDAIVMIVDQDERENLEEMRLNVPCIFIDPKSARKKTGLVDLWVDLVCMKKGENGAGEGAAGSTTGAGFGSGTEAPKRPLPGWGNARRVAFAWLEDLETETKDFIEILGKKCGANSKKPIRIEEVFSSALASERDVLPAVARAKSAGADVLVLAVRTELIRNGLQFALEEQDFPVKVYTPADLKNGDMAVEMAVELVLAKKTA